METVATDFISEMEIEMRYGLLGEKLGHSFSPVLHAQMGKSDYGLIPVSKEEVDAFLDKADFDGINVTIPYKEVAMKHCKPDEIATDIGCVNTLLNKGDEILGFNTDCLGFAYIAKSIGTDWKDKKVVILGSGGTSKTATYVALKSGAKSVTIVSRKKPEKEEDRINKPEYATGEQVVYKSDYASAKEWQDAKILVNTTPVGMYPNNDATPIDLDVFEGLEAVIDVIYNPLETYLVMNAKKKGIPATCGLAMLIAQGWYAEEIWKHADELDKVDLKIDSKLSKEAVEEIERVVKIVRNQKENIVLIGMPGSGKTTLGKLLRDKLGRKFIDTDDEFTVKYGMKAGDYITQYGVAEFREKESIVVKEAAKESGVIIATGGGAVLREDNREALRQNGVVVLLNQELEKLATEGRPLSAGDGLKKLYEERMPIYNAFKDVALDVVLDDFYANVDKCLELIGM